MVSVEPQPEKQLSVIAWLHRPTRKHILVFVTVVAWVLIVSRRPAAVFHPMFWAESGTIWYAQAWNLGWKTLWVPYGGYLQVVPRLVALLATYFPITYGPSIFVGVAWIAQVAPLWYWFSSRFDAVVPSWYLRGFLGLLYLVIPNSYEVNMNLTNSQVHLALVAFLLLYTSPPTSKWSHRRDIVVLALAALSGPYCLLLWPVALWQWWSERDRWRLQILMFLTATSVVQGTIVLVFAKTARSAAPLGASLGNLLRIVGGQVLTASLFGMHEYARISSLPQWHGLVLPLLVVVAGGVVVAHAARTGPPILRGLIVYAGLVLTAALMLPLVSMTQPQWPLMAVAGEGNRYYFIPMLAWTSSLLYCLTSNRAHMLRWVATVLLSILLIVGIPRDWAYPAYAPLYWNKYASEVQSARPGSTVSIPINPPGWSMELHIRAQ